MTLKAYSKYKDSGVEWLGEVPEHWEVKSLKRVFETIGSGTTPKSSDLIYYEDGDIPWINTGDLNDQVLHHCKNFVTQAALKEYSALKIYPKNSLIIAMYGATIGKVGISDFPYTSNQACCNFVSQSRILMKFTYFCLLGFRKQIIALAYGGGQPNINQEILRNLLLVFPNNELEMEKIAFFLEQETGKIDSLILEQEKLITLLSEKRQALISHVVTKGLDPSVPMKDSGVEWLGEVPGHWEVKKLKNIFELKTQKAIGKIFPVGLENIESWSGRFIQTESEFEGAGIEFLAGDILFGKLRPYLAKASLMKCHGEAIGDFFVLKPQKGINKQFGLYLILNKSMIAILNSSTYGAKMPRVSWEFMANIRIAYPPFLEQSVIVNFLDQETEKIDSLVDEVKKAIELLKERRSALISAAVTGKIDVRDHVS